MKKRERERERERERMSSKKPFEEEVNNVTHETYTPSITLHTA